MADEILMNNPIKKISPEDSGENYVDGLVSTGI